MATRYNQTRINIEKKKDDNGFAYFDALAGGVGVLKYRENGQIVRELRHPDDVFQAESMQSLAMKPFTLQHEGGMVKPESATGVTRGTTGENIRREGEAKLFPGPGWIEEQVLYGIFYLYRRCEGWTVAHVVRPPPE